MDRRRTARRLLAPDEPLAHAKLRTGGRLIVLDASSWGALTETTERLLPGRHLDVHVVTSGGRVLVRGRVARAYVSQLQPEAIYYRAALAFEQAIDARSCGYQMPAVLVSPATPQGMPFPVRTGDSDIEFTERLSAQPIS
jgi:hypothetical protein